MISIALEQLDSLVSTLKNKARELCPDYPNIQNELEPSEYLWAITSSLEGTRLANKDCHDYITFLLSNLGWTSTKGIIEYAFYKETLNNKVQ